MNQRTLTSALTVLVSIAWLTAFVWRIYNPEWTGGQTTDAIMLVVVSYWFASNALMKRDGS